MLAVSALVLAFGLLGLSLAPSLPVFLAAWIVLGAGMGAGLYDPAFATLGRLYGESGRSAITTLTLFGGFASTVCWPLSAFLVTHVGWRDTCLIYAAIQLGLSLPVYLFAVPREPRQLEAAPAVIGASVDASAMVVRDRGLFALMAVVITLGSMISAALSVHLLTVLQSNGLALTVAVGLGALVGPSQVAARFIEMLVARYHHPIWTKVVSTSLVAAGLAALCLGGSAVTPALALYGAGIGLESIARGTLPLAVFGPKRYPIAMGRIAMPSLIAQAAAPFIGVLLLQAAGANGLLAGFLALALVNVLLVVGLLLVLRSRASAALVAQTP